MKKDIIIIGPEKSGKTLFAKMIFEKEKTFHVVDSSKTTISDLTKLIEEEELIIKTHW